MKNLLYLLFFILFCTPHALANETIPLTPKCNGKWVLTDASGWAVRNEEGLILPLSYNTVVLGCAKTPINLKHQHSGKSVVITCSPSNLEFGLPTVTKVIIICK